jgi:disulfide oxidoreductase YuzD
MAAHFLLYEREEVMIMAKIVNVNFKLYKSTALVNIAYDGVSYKEGQELSIRETDIKELADERHLVEMIERPEKQEQIIPPVVVNEQPETENNDKETEGETVVPKDGE